MAQFIQQGLSRFAMYLARGVDDGPKKYFIGGNWKMNCSVSMAAEIVGCLNSAEVPAGVEVVVAPPELYLGTVKDTINAAYKVCAQAVCYYPGMGARTGAISGEILKDCGIEWTIIGHSERRTGFGIGGETDEVVATKTVNALNAGLSAIVCIGETKDEREAGQTLEVVLEKNLAAVDAALKAAYSDADYAAKWASIVLAYEPVWAIGTGLSATPEMAQEVHAAIREWLKVNVSEEIAAATRVIYGGSVKAANAAELIAMEDIDGFLVGGASLKPQFLEVISIAAAHMQEATAATA